MEDGIKFCTKCGTPLYDTNSQHKTENSSSERVSKGKNVIPEATSKSQYSDKEKGRKAGYAGLPDDDWNDEDDWFAGEDWYDEDDMYAEDNSDKEDYVYRKNVDSKREKERNTERERSDYRPHKEPEDVEVSIPDEYRPITMWGYVGYQLLFAIPIVGFVMVLIYSFGRTKNVHLRNFSRSFLCSIIVGIIIAIIRAMLS